MNIVMQRFFSEMEKTDNKSDEIVTLDTPRKVAMNEPLYFGFRSGLKRISSHPIRIGVSFNTLAHLSRRDKMSLSNLSRQIKSDQYVISVGDTNGKRKGQGIFVAFGVGTDGKVKSKAYLHAILLGSILKNYDITATYFQSVEEKNLMAERSAAEKVESLWTSFLQSTHQAGWDLEGTDLQSEGYELSLK